jgi:hypothetical protein
MADHFGRGVTFTGLAGVAALGLVLVLALMPETRPDQELDADARRAPA